MKPVEASSDVEWEYVGAELGDSRLRQRLVQVAKALDLEPGASIPDAMETDAALEGAYRFLGNESVTPDGILAGHFIEAAARAETESWVIAVHDTSLFKFGETGTRTGLGHLHGKTEGFLGHVSLLVAPGETRRPLGVLSLQTIVREQPKKRAKGEKRKRPAFEMRESQRWLRGVEATEQRLAGSSPVVHVMDREGDSFDLWSALAARGSRFVIRSSHDRRLKEGKISNALSRVQTVVERTVALTKRPNQKIEFNQGRYPPRNARLAKLAIGAAKLTLPRPAGAAPGCPETLDLNFVYVREVETHGGNAPVEWTLVTTEPVQTSAEIERIVDIYRSRWTIEEYFKAIKTGCAYEKRQLESFESLVNALAIFIPIAWRLLLVRTLSRDLSDEPALQALTPDQLEVLAAFSHKRLPKNPTVREAMLAIASLGGHIKNNGDPGWIVLGRGFEKLLAYELGWQMRAKRDL
ncbi:MAG: IS4 family transposase [Actinobacteria bacterium]|nr:IS4 family transposase [Actinomycetota bacterium]